MSRLLTMQQEVVASFRHRRVSLSSFRRIMSCLYSEEMLIISLIFHLISLHHCMILILHSSVSAVSISCLNRKWCQHVMTSDPAKTPPSVRSVVIETILWYWSSQSCWNTHLSLNISHQLTLAQITSPDKHGANSFTVNTHSSASKSISRHLQLWWE